MAAIIKLRHFPTRTYLWPSFVRTFFSRTEGENGDLMGRNFCKTQDFEFLGKDFLIPGSNKSFSTSLKSSLKSEKISMRGSVDPKEIAKFSAIADTWWDPKGMHRGLHAMNPTRMSFIRSSLCRHFGGLEAVWNRRENSGLQPLKGLRVIDVGCGGGLLCEPLARLGAQVVGLDASEKNVSVAALHAARDPMTKSIQYVCSTAEELVEEGQTFDAVFSLEVIEHVADSRLFMKAIGALCIPGGAVCISTINRTARSYALAIVAAEYVLRWLPPETHDWSRFVTPQEMALLMNYSGLQMEEIAGMVFDPLTGNWSLDEDLSVNYIAFGTKSQENKEIQTAETEKS